MVQCKVMLGYTCDIVLERLAYYIEMTPHYYDVHLLIAPEGLSTVDWFTFPNTLLFYLCNSNLNVPYISFYFPSI